MKTWKKLLIIIVCVFLLISVGGFVAYKVIGSRVVNILYAGKPGNGKEYGLDAVAADSASPLRGKTIIFLGSSITEGYGSGQVTFVEYLEKKDGVIAVKEAKGGTTLVDDGGDSYISRMKTIDTGLAADAFVCQLSTNDATKELPLGAVSDSTDKEDFDTATVAGSIEYIIAYAQETWDCPVVFHISPRYDSEAYGAMVSLLLDIQKKWDITVIDMWNDAEVNATSESDRSLYMIDDIHPTKAGYLVWWLPQFEKTLEEVFR
ncbi:MAG: SGNH/GDSL hydrolase family protein [bacterium]|nr:SGNH/GDSL hydrolase family protein [bacterium]